MIQLKVGDYLNPGVTSFEDGVHYNYTLGCHTLTIAVKDPSISEIAEVQVKQSMFALEIVDEAVILLSKFGGAPWRFAHYNWWINAPVMRADPVSDLKGLNNGGFWINVCLVNSLNGFIEALRSVYLSHELSFLLLQNVAIQTHCVFDPWHYLEVIERTSRKFRDTNSILSDAICVCAGDVVLANYASALGHGLYN
jgi:hypothetical protein